MGLLWNKAKKVLARLKMFGRVSMPPENNADEMDVPANRFEFTLFVLNIYYVLLTRGIDGIRVGFWHNPQFIRYMIDTLEIR